MEKNIKVRKVMARKIKQVNEDLSIGAIKINDAEVNKLLEEIRKFEIAFYDKHSCSMHKLLFEYKGLELKEYPVLHPYIEGYFWFRGYSVKLKSETKILLFIPWMRPWLEDGISSSVIYTIGKVPKETVLDFVKIYKKHVESWAEKINKDLSKSYEL